ncbi:MAG: protein-glutamate methylesterase/protein-glutamine glutaminase [Ignavibacteriales bacterium]
MIKVMVVDDSAFMRRVISDIINQQTDMQVVGTARDGQETLQKVKDLAPDVITMDVEMPVMDGLQALEVIMKENPLPIIMLSGLTRSGADATMKALHLGAVDFIPKPSGSISLDIDKISVDIVDKIRIAAATRGMIRRLPSVAPRLPQPLIRPTSVTTTTGLHKSLNKLVVIGTSTGGPKALHEVIPGLPGDLMAGVLVVQHMPPGFTRSLADRLNSLSEVTVKEAEHGEPVLPGHVYVAPGDYHLKVKRRDESTGPKLFVNLTQDPLVSGHRPSVDAMFESVVQEFWSPVLGVVMTGMGSDGTKGAGGIKQKGGKIIAEDKSTCIVYGMPKSVIESGNSDIVAPLPNIAREIVKSI